MTVFLIPIISSKNARTKFTSLGLLVIERSFSIAHQFGDFSQSFLCLFIPASTSCNSD